MRNFLTVTFIIFCSLRGISQEDFILRLNDTLINIELDRPYNLKIKGTAFNFTVSSKDTLTFKNESYNFLYPKQFKISNSKIDDGISQISIVNAEGSGLIIQKYESINPSSLKELMLTEMMKESISYGFKEKRTVYKRTLKSGQEIEVIKAVLRFKDDVNIFEVSSISKKDEGLIIVTMRMDDDANTEGQNLINLMWQSLKVQ